MTPRTWAFGDVDGEGEEPNEEPPLRDRPYESFGEQGLALPTYCEVVELQRGAERVDLGEPIARPLAAAITTGPKNWQRRDDRIYDDICVRLTDDGYIDATDIEVIVHQGEVTLSGRVSDPAQRARAIHIAEGVRGVVEVLSRIRVRADS
jgi:hypothetical protein